MTNDLVPARVRVYLVRETPVILDSDLATALGMETKRLNEAIKRNSDLIDDRHRFQLTREEFDSLRSQIATSKGRGGRTHLPWVFTDRGVTRVTTFINTPEAIRASDLIVDTFITVQKQVSAGHKEVLIEQPSRYHHDEARAARAESIAKKVMQAVDAVLDTVVDIETGNTVADTAKDLAARALENFRERLREKGLHNLKMEAEIQVIWQQAELLAQEVEGKKLDNLEKKLNILERLMRMQQELETPQVVQLLDAFDVAPRALIDQTTLVEQTRKLPAPDLKRAKTKKDSD